MKSIILGLNKTFDSRIRLGIMSALMVNESIDFIALKELLDTSDGNLSSHIKALEKNDMVVVHKQFVGKKPNTSFSITSKGRKAFEEHLMALEKLLAQR